MPGIFEGGFFLNFEGGERVGKTTQVTRAAGYLRELGFAVVQTKEPGGGDPNIREKLLAMGMVLTPEEELDLFCEDRRLHVENLISPALKEGKAVITDRFEPSSVAYQGYGRGLGIGMIRAKSAKARNGVWPHRIILLDADPEIALQRKEAVTRFDVETIDFHNRVRRGFLDQATEDRERWQIIDATLPVEEVWQRVKECIDADLRERAAVNT